MQKIIKSMLSILVGASVLIGCSFTDDKSSPDASELWNSLSYEMQQAACWGLMADPAAFEYGFHQTYTQSDVNEVYHALVNYMAVVC